MSDAPRQAALDLLRAVRADDAYANLVLPALLAERGIGGRDAAFATELGYGTLRWQGWYDAIIDACVARDPGDVEFIVRDVLRLGCHQLLAMRVPIHAAIDSTVDLARRNGNPGSARGRAGFVNAVLRSVAARSADEWAVALDVTGSGDRALSVRLSHPEWIVRALGDALSTRRAELPALLAADNEPQRPVLVARGMSGDDLRALPDVEPVAWSPIGARLLRGAPDSVPAVVDGRAGVQDEGSQLVALALAAAQVDGPEHDWLDMCAGPGGKAAVLAGLAQEAGAALTAVELHPHRAELVRRALGAGSTAQVLVGDATAAPWGARRFDRVLVDAPCTGLGALRRRPEARWRRTPADLTALGPLQRRLLDAAADATRPGGVIAYATCSPHLAETELVVRDVVRRRPDLRIEDAGGLLPMVPDATVGPFVQLWPHRHGTDGMFLAMLRREDG